MSAITSRVVTVEAAGYKHDLDISFGDGLISVDRQPSYEELRIAVWTVENVFDLPAFVEKLRAMGAVAMTIMIEEEGIAFKRIPRDVATYKSYHAAMSPEHVTHFHEQHPFTRNHRFNSLEQFEAWVKQQPTD
jgi:hypothetical protein